MPPSDGPRSWEVSPAGTPGGDGTSERPLDLATALAEGTPVRPGDTVWLRGGTYRGVFTSRLTGTADAPIVVRAARGERAILDGNSAAAADRGVVLFIFGAHTWYWGFEVTSSAIDRVDTGEPSAPSGISVLDSHHIRLINLTVHDMPATGIGFWSENSDSEIYGCLVYYNGLNHFDHGLYVQNRRGVKRIVDNVVFRQSGHGVHAYGSDAAFLDDIELEGNTVFNNGELIGSAARNILIGGGSVARRPRLTDNVAYYADDDGENNLGYEAGCADAVVERNSFLGGRLALQLARCLPSSMTGNLLRGAWHPQNLPELYPVNTFEAGLPGGTRVAIRPNRYERGRAVVTIVNWAQQTQVDLDLAAAGLQAGERFEVRDVQNPTAAPVLSGTYQGTAVPLVLTGLTTALPVWRRAERPAHTAPEFAVFLIEPRP
jgi:hypothetical protein